MEKAVDVAESNMSRFGLTAQDVASRRKWVLKTRQQVWPCLGFYFIGVRFTAVGSYLSASMTQSHFLAVREHNSRLKSAATSKQTRRAD